MFICPALRGAAQFSTSTSVSVYEFADRTAPPFRSLALKLPEPAGLAHGAAHTAELPYLFGYKSIARPLSAEQQALSSKMMALWTDFGRPTSPWPKWTPEAPIATLITDQANGGIQTRTDLATQHHCTFWADHPETPNSLFP